MNTKEERREPWTPTRQQCQAESPAVEAGTSSDHMASTPRYGCVCPSSLSWLGPMRAGNPEYGNIMQLYSSTGFHLSILSNGNVQGSEEDEYKYALLEIISLSPTEVRFHGLEANLYLAMNADGLLYGEADPNDNATVFIVSQHGQYNIYKSKNHGWFVGIKKNGTAKPGPLTKRGQKAIQFLPRRLNR